MIGKQLKYCNILHHLPSLPHISVCFLGEACSGNTRPSFEWAGAF